MHSYSEILVILESLIPFAFASFPLVQVLVFSRSSFLVAFLIASLFVRNHLTTTA